MENLKSIFDKSLGHKLALVCFAITVLAILPFPYEFYILIRLVFFVAVIWCGWQLYQKNKQISIIHFVIAGLAILYNPFFLIHLGSKLVWFVINIGTAFFILKIFDKLFTVDSTKQEELKAVETTPEIDKPIVSKKEEAKSDKPVLEDSKSEEKAPRKPAVKKSAAKKPQDVGVPVFKLALGKTYFNQGFFNVGVNFERYVTSSDEDVTIYVGPKKDSISGRSSRKHNINGTPRIYGGASLRDWFQKNFEVGETVDVKFINPTTVWLT